MSFSFRIYDGSRAATRAALHGLDRQTAGLRFPVPRVPLRKHQEVPQFAGVIAKARLVLAPKAPNAVELNVLFHVLVQDAGFKWRFQARSKPLRQGNDEAGLPARDDRRGHVGSDRLLENV